MTGWTAAIAGASPARPPVDRMPGGLGSELGEVHRLARPHLHHEPDAVGHRDRVLRDVGQPRGPDQLVLPPRARHDAVPIGAQPGLDDRHGTS